MLPESTSPARGTTAKRIPRFLWRLNFNPRPPHGGRRKNDASITPTAKISIHVPRTGDDDRRKAHCPRNQYFNPRPPHGGRLFNCRPCRASDVISIHVPRTGDDFASSSGLSFSLLFQSTSPARGTTGYSMKKLTVNQFQSTSPVRGTTIGGKRIVLGINISIHVPRTGDDKSRGVAFTDNLIISIHIPRTGDDTRISLLKCY